MNGKEYSVWAAGGIGTKKSSKQAEFEALKRDLIKRNIDPDAFLKRCHEIIDKYRSNDFNPAQFDADLAESDE